MNDDEFERELAELDRQIARADAAAFWVGVALTLACGLGALAIVAAVLW